MRRTVALRRCAWPCFCTCLVPTFDGASLSSDSKDALRDRFCMGAPRRHRRSVERYSMPEDAFEAVRDQSEDGRQMEEAEFGGLSGMWCVGP
jgi:hypothetical protein